MRFFRYCRDRWLSVLIFVFVFAAGGGILWLIGTPFAVACVVEGFYAAGFFLILLVLLFSIILYSSCQKGVLRQTS